MRSNSKGLVLVVHFVKRDFSLYQQAKILILVDIVNRKYECFLLNKLY